jgi:apolipoprotein N-acyltransferase
MPTLAWACEFTEKSQHAHSFCGHVTPNFHFPQQKLFILRKRRHRLAFGRDGMTFLKTFASSTFLYGALGALLYWLALPSLDLWPLAWIAPIPWALLVRRKDLDGPRPYFSLWVVGFFFWLTALHWLRLPHPAMVLGLIGLAFYFAFYVPALIGLSRVAVHRFGWPVMLALPTVWTGLELARTYLLTGMSMGDISHTQYRWIALIQISDLAGQFGVCFVIVFVASSIARMLPCKDAVKGSRHTPCAVRPHDSSRHTPCAVQSPVQREDGTRSVPATLVYWPLIPAVVLLALTLGYGHWRTANVVTKPGPRIALIQGAIDSRLQEDPAKSREQFFETYFKLTKKACDEAKARGLKLDLIVWPEIYFRTPLYLVDPDAAEKFEIVTSGKMTAERCREEIARAIELNQLEFRGMADAFQAPMLIGLDAWHYTSSNVKFFNSAAYLARNGELIGRYSKMHLVPFGEYIPLGDVLPWLYGGLTPLSGGMTPGREPEAFSLSISSREAQGDTLRFAPNICYETVLSRVIRGQINRLQSQDREPDLLVNVSNDSWYGDTSELDMLLACSVFRAVECRKPYVIAANAGISASIDADGRILEKGPRYAEAVLLADIRLDPRRSFYLEYGDWPASICLIFCVFFGLAGIQRGFRLRRDRKRAIA